MQEFLDRFKDEKSCIDYYEALRWNGKPVCPHCGSKRVITTKKSYRCSDKECRKDFTVTVGTIFHSSKIPMRTWFLTLYLYRTHKKGISSVQLSQWLNVSQKTAWFMLHRIRKPMWVNTPSMLGLQGQTIEVDETHVGGREKWRHGSKKRSRVNPNLAWDGSKYNKKKIVIGAIERKGKVILQRIPRTTTMFMQSFIETHILKDTEVLTDEHKGYDAMDEAYNHATVNHSACHYVRGRIHTNTIESFWAVLKRSITGVYYHVSDKHFDRYLYEFSGRFNTRKNQVMDNVNTTLVNSEGRLSYKELISD